MNAHIPRMGTFMQKVHTDPLEGSIHKRQIDLPYAIEIVAELYGDVIPLLNKNSLIFGGIVRDIVANMFPLCGDLDIVTYTANYVDVTRLFDSCNKITAYTKKSDNNLRYNRKPNVGMVHNYKTFDGKRIQVIGATDSILNLITSVDFAA